MKKELSADRYGRKRERWILEEGDEEIITHAYLEEHLTMREIMYKYFSDMASEGWFFGFTKTLKLNEKYDERWLTPELKERLIKEYPDSIRIRDFARDLGVGATHVSRWAKKFGLMRYVKLSEDECFKQARAVAAMKDKEVEYSGTVWEIHRNDLPWDVSYLGTIRAGLAVNAYDSLRDSAIAKAFMYYNFNGELTHSDWTLFRCDYGARPPKHVYNEAYHHFPDAKPTKGAQEQINTLLRNRENMDLYRQYCDRNK